MCAVAARFRVADGNPRTAVMGAIYDADGDAFFGIPSPDKRELRLPTFFQLDVRVDKKWVFERWILDCYLDLMNAPYYRNTEAIRQNYDSTQERPVYGLPIFPAFGVKGEF